MIKRLMRRWCQTRCKLRELAISRHPALHGVVLLFKRLLVYILCCNNTFSDDVQSLELFT